MLPDPAAFKKDIQAKLSAYLHAAVKARQGVFAKSPRHIVHEGRSLRVVRADESVEDSPLKEASGEMALSLAEIPNMTHEDLKKKLDEIADKMAGQVQEHLFRTLNDSLDKAGQTVDAKGKPLTAETFFEVLEKLHIDFDENGQPKGLQLVVGPDLMPRIRELAEEEERNPEIRKRHDEIMQRKWIEWRDREASRKLVG